MYAQQISFLQKEIRAQLHTKATIRKNISKKVSYSAQNYGKPDAPKYFSAICQKKKYILIC